MSPLGDALAQYLQVRRALGFKLREHGQLLPGFVERLEQAGAAAVTTELALAWATEPAGVAPFRYTARLSLVRGFARHLHALDPVHEVPPARLLAHRRRRPAPCLYSDTQISGLLAAARHLTPPLRAGTYSTLLGLLAVSGLRVGEAIDLDREDVDLDRGLLSVRHAKHGTSRQLPLHPSTVAALTCYARQKEQLCPRSKEPCFFVSSSGRRLVYVTVRHVFLQLAHDVGLPARPASRLPRIHDLRHSFAVATLLDWYRAGDDVAGRLPLLSAYLGHAKPASSYWYLQAAPELLALAARRLPDSFGEPG